MTTMMQISEEHIERLSAMSRVFQRANRILSAEEVTCSVVDDMYNSAPAWTDGRHITFNARNIYNVATIEDIVQVTGFNYHELSHVLYTPRGKSKLVQEVNTNGWSDAFNILEDQRIESMLTAIYPATIPYFIATFTRYCASNPNDWKANFIIMHGRKYLPIAMRKSFREQFAFPQYAKRIEKIIDEYRKFTFPSDTDKAIKLVEQFNRLLLLMNMVKPKDPFGHFQGQRPLIAVGSPANESEQKDTQDAVDYLDEELDERDEEDLEKLGSSETDADSDSEEDEDGSANGNGSADSDEDADEDSDSDSDSDTDANTGNGSSDTDSDSDDSDSDTGSGNGVSGGDSTTTELPDNYDAVIKVLKAIEQDVLKSTDVIADAKDKQDAMNNGDGDVSINFGSKKYRKQSATPTDIQLVDEFGYELRRLRTDADPYWERFNSGGRINIDRAIRGDDLSELFDEFREGQIDSTEMEAVILLDISSSMEGRMEDASKALWVIKSALEAINASVTVLAFNDSTHLLYDKDEEVEPTTFRVFGASECTMPNVAIRQATKIFNASTRGNKICFIITDGAWDGDMGEDGNDQLIQNMNDAGILTALAYLDYPSFYNNNNEMVDMPEYKRHNCKVAKQMFNTNQLVDLAREIASLSFEHN